jgi:hypothetical protein
MRDPWVETMLCAWRGLPPADREEVIREILDCLAFTPEAAATRIAAALLRALEAA